MSRKQLGDFPSDKRELIPERLRRATACVAQWGGWLGAIALYVVTVVQYDTLEERPPWIGSGFVLLLFIAVVGTTVRSRMRLTQTIIAAFQAGVEVQRIRDRKFMNGEKDDE